MLPGGVQSKGDELMKKNWKKLTSLKDVSTYCKIGRKFWAAEYSESYLLQGDIFGCFNDEGELVGGFALVYDAKLRTLNFFSEDDRQILPIISVVPDEKFCEVAGFWFDPSKKNQNQSTEAWLHLSKAIKNTGKEYLIWGFDSNHKGLANLYKRLGTTIIYSGDVGSGNVPENNFQKNVTIISGRSSGITFRIKLMLLKRIFKRKKRGISILHGKKEKIQSVS